MSPKDLVLTSGFALNESRVLIQPKHPSLTSSYTDFSISVLLLVNSSFAAVLIFYSH